MKWVMFLLSCATLILFAYALYRRGEIARPWRSLVGRDTSERVGLLIFGLIFVTISAVQLLG